MLLSRILKFQVIAWGGTVVNLASLWILHGILEIPLIVAGACAIELAIVHNFIWHYFFTWRDRVGQSPTDFFSRLIQYNVVTASIDFLVNLSVLWTLTHYFGIHYLLADMAGMLGGPVIKFLANEFLIFRRRTPEDL
ncbi:MAG: GtrA family protein [Fidelibacterota bacterium]